MKSTCLGCVTYTLDFLGSIQFHDFSLVLEKGSLKLQRNVIELSHFMIFAIIKVTAFWLRKYDHLSDALGTVWYLWGEGVEREDLQLDLSPSPSKAFG